MTDKVDAYVALGSNIGASQAILTAAMDRLDSIALSPVGRSSIWRTHPVDCPPGSPPFLNAVAHLVIKAESSPYDLLSMLQRWEEQAGRPPSRGTNTPRTLDLDLILFGELRLSAPRLTLPHPRAHLRFFVLAPMAELAPHLIIPGQSLSVSALLSRIPPAGERICHV